MGCKYGRCTNADCENGRMIAAGQSIECPVCEGEGYLDTRMGELFSEPEVAARIDALLGEKPRMVS